MGLQAYFEYKKRTYDPTWIFKFDNIFFYGLCEERTTAAKVLKKFRGNLNRTDAELNPIDEVLDFFDTVGFYVRSDQISQEVAHHHFHHWLQ